MHPASTIRTRTPGSAFLLACGGAAAAMWIASGVAVGWCYRERVAAWVRCWPVKPFSNDWPK